jgi:hypothetical protein
MKPHLKLLNAVAQAHLEQLMIVPVVDVNAAFNEAGTSADSCGTCASRLVLGKGNSKGFRRPTGAGASSMNVRPMLGPTHPPYGGCEEWIGGDEEVFGAGGAGAAALRSRSAIRCGARR